MLQGYGKYRNCKF